MTQAERDAQYKMLLDRQRTAGARCVGILSALVADLPRNEISELAQRYLDEYNTIGKRIGALFDTPADAP
jgi:hypothetical protein